VKAWRGIWFSLVGLALALAGLAVALVKLAGVGLHPEAPGAHLVAPAVVILAALSVVMVLLLLWHGRAQRRRHHLRNAFEVMLALVLAAAAIWGWDRLHPQSAALTLAFDGHEYQIPRAYHPIAYPERGLILGLCAATLEPEYAARRCAGFAEMRFNRLALLDDPTLAGCVVKSGGVIRDGDLADAGPRAEPIGTLTLRYICDGADEALYLQKDEGGKVVAYTRLSGNGVVQHGLRLGGLTLHFPAQEGADPPTEAKRWLSLLESWRCPESGCPASPPLDLAGLLVRE